MLDFLEEYFGYIILILLVFAILCIYASIKMENGLFEYVDYDNNTGLAKTCSKSYGNLRCTTIDNKEIAVISYKKIN